MDNISIDFLKELQDYNEELRRRVDAGGVERICEDIMVSMRELAEKNPDHLHELDVMLIDIKQSKQKITKQNEEIRAYADLYSVSNDEYDEIVADGDVQRREEHLSRFLQERMDEIRGTLLLSGSLDKQVHRLNMPDEMLAMRKDMYVDEKNIAEALSIVLFDDINVERMMRLFLNKKSGTSDLSGAHDKSDEPLGMVWEKSLKEMLRICILIEGYQHEGLWAIRHIEELDRQIVYMLVSLALGKHKR